MKLSFTIFDSTGLEVTQESYNRLLADRDKLARECYRLEQLNSISVVGRSSVRP